MSEKKSQSQPNSNNGNDSDQDNDFDPTADMLVNDFDDEHTLDEEEALEEDNSDELNDLQRESEMPLEELLALYRNMPEVSTTNEDEEEDDESADPETIEPSQSERTSTSQLDNDKLTEQTLKFIDKLEPIPVSSNLSRLISTSEDALYDISDDEEEEDYTPDWRRTIQIGQDYQATIPDTALLVNEPMSYAEIDSSMDVRGILLWSPMHISEKEVEKYLKTYLNHHTKSSNCVSTLTKKNETNLATNAIQRDDELALYVLIKNDYDPDNVVADKNELDNELIEFFTYIKPWSEEDCLTFEEGLRVHGKDFHQIQKKLPHKTVNELVHFYYYWKKTERHDMFASKFKFEKRKYSLNHHVTDLMDHFLDDNQPQQTSFNSTSSSLNSSLSNTITHSNKLNSSSWTLLPASNHQITSVTTNEHLKPINTTHNNPSSTNQLTSSNNLDENSSSSSEGLTSKLVINEFVDLNSNDQPDDLLVTSSSVGLIKTIIKPISEECVSSLTGAATSDSSEM